MILKDFDILKLILIFAHDFDMIFGVFRGSIDVSSLPGPSDPTAANPQDPCDYPWGSLDPWMQWNIHH